MPKLILTFAELLKKARRFKRQGWSRQRRADYLAGLINGAENWELPK